jgi:integrase
LGGRRMDGATMGQGKQAKILTDAQVRAALSACDGHRYPLRDRVMVLLSVRAGLRAKEIARLKWRMVTDAEGEVGDALHLGNKSSKGRNGGRTIPLHAELRAALLALKETRTVDADDRVIFSERTIGMSPTAVQVWFHRHYAALGFVGASSHSGRRTFVAKLAKKIVEAGGSLRDVQELAGHASLTTTQRFIQGSNDAKRRVMGLI